MKRPRRLMWIVPFAAGAIIAGAVGVGAFAFLDTLTSPTSTDKVTAHVIGYLDKMHESRSLITVAGLDAERTVCTTGGRQAHVRIGSHLRLRLRVRLAGVRIRRLSGPPQSSALLEAEAVLSACPRSLANALTTRLFADKRTLLKRMHVHGQPVDVFEVFNGRRHHRLQIVQLLVGARNLAPVEIRYLSPRLSGRSEIVQMLPAALPVPIRLSEIGKSSSGQ